VDWGFENKKIDPLKSEELLKNKNGPLADLSPRQTPGACPCPWGLESG
jgi:hypothetical protein